LLVNCTLQDVAAAEATIIQAQLVVAKSRGDAVHIAEALTLADRAVQSAVAAQNEAVAALHDAEEVRAGVRAVVQQAADRLNTAELLLRTEAALPVCAM
jgi:hypothetical protein